MAVQFRSAATLVAGNGTSPTATEPAGAANGDVLVALLLCASSGNPVKPAGWTDLYADTVGGMDWLVSYIVRGGSAPGLTWTITGNIYRELYVICLNSDSAGTISLDSQSSAGASGTSAHQNIDPPATVAVASTSMAVSGGINFVGSGTGGYTASTNYAIRTDNTVGNDGFMQTRSLNAAGSEDPGTVNSHQAGSGDWWDGFTITFTDVGGGGGGNDLSVGVGAVGEPVIGGSTF